MTDSGSATPLPGSGAEAGEALQEFQVSLAHLHRRLDAQDEQLRRLLSPDEHHGQPRPAVETRLVLLEDILEDLSGRTTSMLTEVRRLSDELPAIVEVLQARVASRAQDKDDLADAVRAIDERVTQSERVAREHAEAVRGPLADQSQHLAQELTAFAGMLRELAAGMLRENDDLAKGLRRLTERLARSERAAGDQAEATRLTLVEMQEALFLYISEQLTEVRALGERQRKDAADAEEALVQRIQQLLEARPPTPAPPTPAPPTPAPPTPEPPSRRRPSTKRRTASLSPASDDAPANAAGHDPSTLERSWTPPDGPSVDPDAGRRRPPS